VQVVVRRNGVEGKLRNRAKPASSAGSSGAQKARFENPQSDAAPPLPKLKRRPPVHIVILLSEECRRQTAPPLPEQTPQGCATPAPVKGTRDAPFAAKIALQIEGRLQVLLRARHPPAYLRLRRGRPIRRRINDDDCSLRYLFFHFAFFLLLT